MPKRTHLSGRRPGALIIALACPWLTAAAGAAQPPTETPPPAGAQTPPAPAPVQPPVQPPAAADPASPPPAPPPGILPVPDYSGLLAKRRFLTGDWGGTRTDLANKGVQVNADWVQTLQSVVDGGRDSDTEYGGSLDYLVTLDLDRMGLMQGGLVKFRAESRYGDSVNSISGSILPVSTDSFFPLHEPIDSDINLTVSDLAYYQFLSEKVALLAGKLNTLDSDLNEFASGRGNSQFLNTQFLFNSTMSLMPYSTLGAGVILMPTGNITVTSMVINLTDASTTSGFSDIGDGAAWSSEASTQYQLGSLPGGANVGAVYIWDAELFDFDGRFTLDPGEGIALPTTSDTWMAYLSGWQYAIVKDEAKGPLDLANGEPDLAGMGLFWRAGIADDDVNPVELSISGGVGGKGMIPGRERDFFGVGYYYNSVQTLRVTGSLLDDHTQGVECFYNISLTPAAQLTLDAQVIESAQLSLDPAVILGMRLKLEF